MNKAIVFGAGILSLFLSVTARAEVSRDERDVVLVVDLSTHAIERYKWFYGQAEEFSIRKAGELLTNFYHEVRIISVRDATLENLQRELAKLADRTATRAIDVIVELHGSPGALTFHEGGYDLKQVRDKLRSTARLSTKLRALYSGACYGTTHADELIAGGFKVASGAVKVNTNGMFDYPAFLKAWTAGETFTSAQTKGNHPYWIRFFDNLARDMGMGDANSFKEVHGASAMTIASDVPESDLVPRAESAYPEPMRVTPIGYAAW